MNLAKFRTPAFKDKEEMEHVVMLDWIGCEVEVAHLDLPSLTLKFTASDCYISIISCVKVRVK